MSKLIVSDNLSLPRDVMASTQAILAQKGAGKTYAAMKMMEEAVKGGLQAISRLRTLELISGKTLLKASDELFD